jgi:hypothetical protein
MCFKSIFALAPLLAILIGAVTVKMRHARAFASQRRCTMLIAKN